MKHPTIQSNTVRVLALVAGLSLAMSAKATVPTSELPDLDNLPLFAWFGNNLDGSADTVNGNAGVSNFGTFVNMAPSTINGDVYVGVSASLSGPGHITGMTHTGVDLTEEQNTVFSASEALDALPADEVIPGNETGPLSFDVPAGEVEVVDLNGGLNLNGQNITLTGGGDLVLNILGSFTMGSSGDISGAPQNIFINYLGTSTVNTHVGNTIDGQVFIPNAAGNIDGTWNGAMFSGDQKITILSASTLNGVPVPEPGILALAAIGGISTIILRRRLCTLKN